MKGDNMEFWFDDARKTLIAVHDGCAVGIRRFMSVITPGVIPEECSIVHAYSRDTKMYPEIDNDGFLTIRLLTGESCRMVLTGNKQSRTLRNRLRAVFSWANGST